MPTLRERALPELGASGLVRQVGGVAGPVLQSVAAADKREGGDFVQRLREEAEKRREASVAGGLTAALLDGRAGLGRADALLSPADRALAQAERCVREEKYAEALGHLDTLLREAPGHPEGSYLRGCCLWKLEKPQDALRALLPLRRARLGGTLPARLAALTAEIRGHLSLRLLLTSVLLLETGRAGEAAERLREAAALDPEAALYRCLLAHALAMDGRFDEAAAAVREGVEWCPAGPDREMLDAADAEVGRRRLVHLLAPARDRYRAGNYPRARAALRRVPPELRTHPLVRAFSGYLDALGGGLFGLVAGRSPADLRPPGSFQEVDALHFFLVEEEIGAARALLAGDEPDAAGLVLEGALRLAPCFPYAHHLMAVSLYRSAAAPFQEGDADEAARRLSEAQRHAALAAEDPEISANAGLVRAVDAALDAVEAVRRELATLRAEAEWVNGFIRAYNAALELAGDGIESTPHLDRVDGALEALEHRLPPRRVETRTPAAREALHQLRKTVIRQRKELASLRYDVRRAEEVRALVERFAAVMRDAEGAVGTRALREGVRRDLGRIRDEARTLRRTMADGDERRALDQLEAAVERNLAQLDEGAVEHARAVNALGEEFAARMREVSGGVRSRDQLQSLKRRMEELRDRAQSLRSGYRGRGSDGLDPLIDAIDRVLEQARAHL